MSFENLTPLTPSSESVSTVTPLKRANSKTKVPKKTRSFPRVHSFDSSPSTPTIAETYDNLKKNLSFKNLRDLEIRNAVWRKAGEERRRPGDWDRLTVFAIKGFFRSFLLGYNARTGINLMFLLLSLISKKKKKPIAPFHIRLLKTLTAQDSFSLGLMLGSFAFLFRFVKHSIRLIRFQILYPSLSPSSDPITPGPEPATSPPSPSSSSSSIDEEKEEDLDPVWLDAIAGAVAGLAIIAERKDRRLGWSQQMFVRGAQGVWNIVAERKGINIPQGAMWVFGLSCGQIMYSWFFNTNTLDPGYFRWITSASSEPRQSFDLSSQFFKSKTFNIKDIEYMMKRKNMTTPGNLERMKKVLEDAKLGNFEPQCLFNHPDADTCVMGQVSRFGRVFKWMYPVYATLHFLPPVLFRPQAFLKHPQKVLLRSFVGSLKSSAFLSTFVVIFLSHICAYNNSYLNRDKPWGKLLLRLSGKRAWFWWAGFATAAGLLWEDKKRRVELAMYVLPKALESAWAALRNRSYVPFVPGGEILLTCLGSGMLMSCYSHEPKKISSLISTLLYQLVGRA